MSRLGVAGLVLTLLAVVVLAASLVMGLGGGEGAAVDLADEQPGQRVRVEVLNAAGTAGLARSVTEQLRDRGFDVVYYGNAGGGFDRDSSLVIDRAGSPEAAREVADALGISRIEARPDTTLYLEATVVLGRDWPDPATDPASDSISGQLQP